MASVQEQQLKKGNFEILFKDSPDYFAVLNAKMLQEGAFIRFICFDSDKFKEDVWFPISNIHRIKRY